MSHYRLLCFRQWRVLKHFFASVPVAVFSVEVCFLSRCRREPFTTYRSRDSHEGCEAAPGKDVISSRVSLIWNASLRTLASFLYTIRAALLRQDCRVRDFFSDISSFRAFISDGAAVRRVRTTGEARRCRLPTQAFFAVAAFAERHYAAASRRPPAT